MTAGRRKGRATFYCAVPEDLVVPDFLSDKNWAFSGKVEAGLGAPAGFDEARAAICARFIGFYLFQEI